MSNFTIRPCGPLPVTAERSIPFCSASRRASGEAKIRPPSAALAAGAGAAAGAAAGFGASAFGASAAFAGSGALASAFGAATGAGALSPSPASRAIGVLTFTPSVPSATSRSSTTPSSTASTSMVALSVSISAITSPELTVSPFFTCHLARVPSSMVGDRAGIRTSMDMSSPGSSGARLKFGEVGRRPAGLASDGAFLGGFVVVDHGLRGAPFEAWQVDPGDVQDGVAFAVDLDRGAHVAAAVHADQIVRLAVAEAVVGQPAGEADRGVRMARRDGPVAPAEAALAGAQRQVRRRDALDLDAHRAAVALAVQP